MNWTVELSAWIAVALNMFLTLVWLAVCAFCVRSNRRMAATMKAWDAHMERKMKEDAKDRQKLHEKLVAKGIL